MPSALVGETLKEGRENDGDFCEYKTPAAIISGGLHPEQWPEQAALDNSLSNKFSNKEW